MKLNNTSKEDRVVISLKKLFTKQFDIMTLLPNAFDPTVHEFLINIKVKYIRLHLKSFLHCFFPWLFLISSLLLVQFSGLVL